MMSIIRSDAEVVEAIQEAFNQSLLIPHAGITVSASNGTVWLDGTVDWEFERMAAIDRTLDVPGVGAVYNRIAVAKHPHVISVIDARVVDRELVSMPGAAQA